MAVFIAMRWEMIVWKIIRGLSPIITQLTNWRLVEETFDTAPAVQVYKQSPRRKPFE